MSSKLSVSLLQHYPGWQEKKAKPWKILNSKDLPLKIHPIFISLRNDDEQKCVCVLFSEKSNTDHVKIMIA